MSDELIVGGTAGATPIGDISGLIPKHIKTRAELFAAEADNISKAVFKYLAARPSRRKAPFTLAWVYRLNREMFGEVWRWAGERRKTEVLNIGVPYHQIEMSLQTLLDDLAFWRTQKTFEWIECAARLHHRAVQIHPFLNGNGRWARMLANILLKQEGRMPTIWPEEIIGTTSAIRGEYLNAIRLADLHQLERLIELHRRFTS